ncbi:MAG TPA: PIN domain-containing protein [Ktedonobacteraceae bacterium]|nr:PIN domain-containing protein [Ktedonobacteraceae bacterium]
MPIRFIDTGILLRYFTRDDEQKAQQVLNLLLRVERGEEKVTTSSLVIFETVITLQRFYKVPRPRIKELVTSIISLRGLQLPGKNVYYHAFDLYISKNISFADAYNAAYMLAEQIPSIYSWDTDFDKIEGIIRVEHEKVL